MGDEWTSGLQAVRFVLAVAIRTLKQKILRYVRGIVQAVEHSMTVISMLQSISEMRVCEWFLHSPNIEPWDTRG